MDSGLALRAPRNDECLLFPDRLGRLLRRRRRQCGLGAGFLRLGIGPCRFGRNAGRPGAGRHGFGRRRWFGFRTRRRLQRLGRLRQLLRSRVAEFGHRQAEMTSPVVTKAAANRKSFVVPRLLLSADISFTAKLFAISTAGAAHGSPRKRGGTAFFRENAPSPWRLRLSWHGELRAGAADRPRLALNCQQGLNDVAPASDKRTPTHLRMPASTVPLLTILRM